MSEIFLISNRPISHKAVKLKQLRNNCGYYIYIDPQCVVFKSGEFEIIIYGYVQPRNDCFNEYKHLDKHKLISVLYEKYHAGFVQYIKGIFLIIIITLQGIDIFTDHFGLKNCFLYQNKYINALTSSIFQIRHLGVDLEADPENLAIKSILNRVTSGGSIFKSIMRIPSGAHITIKHNVFSITHYWRADILEALGKNRFTEFSLFDFAELVKSNFKNFLIYHKPDQNVISLTGGKDSRTGLAALMVNDIIPHGFTYGNSLSRDVVFAKSLAENIPIPHHVFSPPDNEVYFKNISNDILNYGNPDLSLHRLHRLYSFKKMADTLNGSSAYFAGYMGGEFLMGIYYDDLVFTKYLTDFWETNVKASFEANLEYCFHKAGTIDKDDVDDRICELRCFDPSISLKERQFYSIFEIGIPHHGQDVFLASKHFNFVYPFFIDIDFLEALFRSRFNLFCTDNKTHNLLARYKLYEFNLNIQHLLYPAMDIVPFGKRGSYNTKEFLKGKYYWAFVKSARYLFDKQSYPATYTYQSSFRDFLLDQLSEVNSERSHILNDYYNIPAAIAALRSIKGNTGEGPMHRFSNIVMLYRFMKIYTAGDLV